MEQKSNRRDSRIIVNGGAPLRDCPVSWDVARVRQDMANAERGVESAHRPMWEWDSGFKLDYDGPIVMLSSRFYPPKTHYGPTWEGNVKIVVGDTLLHTKQFDCETLDELKRKVEEYVSWFQTKIEEHVEKIVKSENIGNQTT